MQTAILNAKLLNEGLQLDEITHLELVTPLKLARVVRPRQGNLCYSLVAEQAYYTFWQSYAIEAKQETGVGR